MHTELHVLNPCGEMSQIPHSLNWFGVVEGRLFVKLSPFSVPVQRETIPSKEFADYWLPPEMKMKNPRPFQALVTFDDAGEIVALGYPLGELTWGEAIEVMPIAGMASDRPRLRDVVSVAVSITDIAPTGKCVLTFPVVDRDGEKLFRLSDGWFVDAIPALDDFEHTRYLARPQGAERRWGSYFMNLTVIRKGRVFAHGAIQSTGGMGAYPYIYLTGFVEESYSTRIAAERFEVGDKLRVRFAWHGPYPAVEMFLREATIVNMSHSHEVGKAYSAVEFFAIGAKDLTESSERVLPEMFETKIIRLNKK